MCIVKKKIFIVHSKKSSNYDDSNNNAMFNITQLYSIAQFLRANV